MNLEETVKQLLKKVESLDTIVARLSERLDLLERTTQQQEKIVTNYPFKKELKEYWRLKINLDDFAHRLFKLEEKVEKILSQPRTVTAEKSVMVEKVEEPPERDYTLAEVLAAKQDPDVIPFTSRYGMTFEAQEKYEEYKRRKNAAAKSNKDFTLHEALLPPYLREETAPATPNPSEEEIREAVRRELARSGLAEK